MKTATLAGVDDRGNVGRLKSEYPNTKQVIADAICAKVAQVRADADRIAKEEQARLDDVYGRGEYEAGETQVVKRARANCEYVEELVKRVQVEPVENVYLDCVRYLLRQ